MTVKDELLESSGEPAAPPLDDWRRLTDPGNLRLAWRRLLRSNHGDIKDRVALRAYGFSLARNLEILADKLRNGTYSPSGAERLYQPKSSGTLRGLAVLSVEDSIVYQAMCNVIMRRSLPHLSPFANRHVFAHLPQTEKSPFAVMRWQEQYRRFGRAMEAAWRTERRWLVEADVAAFYDSVDHGLLCTLLEGELQIARQLIELIGACLASWSYHPNGRPLMRGLPQGHQASDLLSTVFLSQVDREMCRQGSQDVYLRYVDDIRILCWDRNSALRALAGLGQAMSQVGLILNTSKASVRAIDGLEAERDARWGELSLAGRAAADGTVVPQAKLREEFLAAFSQLSSSRFAESRLVFALGRLEPTDAVRDRALLLLDTMPWRSAVVIRHLAQYRGDQTVIDGLSTHIKSHRVYGWHLANCLRGLSSVAEPSVFSPICKEWVANTRLPWYQRLAAAKCLSKVSEEVAFCASSAASESHPLVRRALLVTSYDLVSESEDSRSQMLRDMLCDPDQNTQRVGIYLALADSDLGWNGFRDLESRLGGLQFLVVEGARRGECYIAGTLLALFGVKEAEATDFRDLLADDYDAATQHLRVAIGEFDTCPSRFVSRIDNFNTILTKSCFARLLPDIRFLPENYAGHLQQKRFQDAHPIAAAAFGKCHRVRSGSDEAHAYSQASGSISEPVSYGMRDHLHQALGLAYAELLGHRAEAESASKPPPAT